jgi:DNA-binding NtrC family response regulator
LEREYIHHVLTTTSGKKEQVAAILGIDRKTLYRKEREYDLHS